MTECMAVNIEMLETVEAPGAFWDFIRGFFCGFFG